MCRILRDLSPIRKEDLPRGTYAQPVEAVEVGDQTLTVYVSLMGDQDAPMNFLRFLNVTEGGTDGAHRGLRKDHALTPTTDLVVGNIEEPTFGYYLKQVHGRASILALAVMAVW